MAFRKIKAGLVNGDVEQFVGETGNIFFDIEDGALRLSDGVTLGGIAVSGGSGGGSYTLPTASTSVKGGVKVDGTTINIANQVISVGTVPYSNISGNPTAVSAFTNDSGYLTNSALSSYATQSYVTSRGYVTSSSVPTAVSQLTNDSNFLVQSNFDLDTINLDSNNKLHATGILPGDSEGFTAIFAGRAAGVAALPNTVIQSQAQVNDYAQNNFQNTYDGNWSSTEWVATSPNGDDSNYYIDMGINGASWDGTAENSLYTNVGQRDGWVYVQGGNAGGGNLILGTSLSNTYTKIISGDASLGDTEVIRFSSTEIKLKKQLTFNDNTTQTTAWLGTYSYNDLTDTPTLVTSYNDLSDLPSLVTSYNDLSDLPSLFSGAYDDLTGKPSLFSGSYNDLTDTPVTVQSLGELTDVDLTTPPVIGQVLKYDGTKWAPGTDITAGGSGTDADTLDGFDSTYFLNYNNFTNKPTIPTTVTVNGTAITLGSSGTITANTTNALTIGYGLTGTASTFDGSAANTVKLDTSTTAVTATSAGTLTLSAATMTRNYVVTGGAVGSSYIIKLPNLTTLTVGQQVTFHTAASPISFQLSDGTILYNNSSTGTANRSVTFTVMSTAANSSANLAYSALPYGSSTPITGTGQGLVTNVGPSITNIVSNSVDNGGGTLALGSSVVTLALAAAQASLTQTVNIATMGTAATYTKTVNIGTNLGGGTSAINIGTGVISGTATIGIGSTTSTTTMNGAVTITSLTATNSIVGSVTGNAATATKLGTARAINGVNFDGSAAITVTASTPNYLTFGTGLTGTVGQFDGSTAVTLAIANTVALKADTTYIGTTSIALNRSSASQTLTGVSIDGNAATVTNGVYTSGTYANPSWITSLAYSKLTGTPTIFSGSYTDLTNKPTIPTNVSELTNDSGFITSTSSLTNGSYSVTLNSDGTVTLPSNTLDSGSNTLTLQSTNFSSLRWLSAIGGGPGVAYDSTVKTNSSGVTISASSGLINLRNISSWVFDSTGNMTFPDTTVQTTAYTATAAKGLFSASNNSASGSGGSLSYSNGVFTFTPVLNITGNAATVTNGVYTTDTGTVTNTMLAGSIANAKLANSSVTINGTSVSLGGSGTVTAAAGTLTGTTLNSTVVSSSLTSVGTLTSGTIGAGFTAIANARLANSSVTVGTTAISLGSSSTTLAGLTSVTSTSFVGALTGNASTVTNGVYTTDTGTVTNAMLAGSIANAKLANSSVTIGSTAISLGGSSLTLDGLTRVESGGGATVTLFNNPTLITIGPTYVLGSHTTNITTGAQTAGTTRTINIGTNGLSGSTTTIAIGSTNGSTTTINGTVVAAVPAGTLTGSTLASGVTASSLTSVGTLTNLNVTAASTVVSNMATDHYIAVGTNSKIFDDGNLHLHGSTGSVWINSLDSSAVKINSQYNSGSGGGLEVTGTTVSNASTAFRAGSSAISNVALEMPRESALRNLYNGANYMYFDVSIGGTTDGGFQFRGSSNYNVYAMIDSTGITSNTPRKARTNWNSTIDTELTVGNFRFRISNQGGIFPQLISNTGGTLNVCWTSVATYNGYGITQLGNTGVIIANNAWTTIFNGHGMDAAGDTCVAHITDKGNGNVYRVTFIRADNGSTTGYSIFAEKLW